MHISEIAGESEGKEGMFDGEGNFKFMSEPAKLTYSDSPPEMCKEDLYDPFEEYLIDREVHREYVQGRNYRTGDRNITIAAWKTGDVPCAWPHGSGKMI